MVQDLESMENMLKHPNQTLELSYALLKKRMTSYRGGTRRHVRSPLQHVL